MKKFLATAYSITGRTADGTWTRRGKVAADPGVLPLGSHIRVLDAGPYSGRYKVSDTGGKIKGHRLDLFMPSWREAKQFGVQWVMVEVLTPEVSG